MGFTQGYRILTAGLFVLAASLVGGVSSGCGNAAHSAVQADDPATLRQVLKDNPSRVTDKDEMGRTALHQAAYRGNKPTAEILLDHGADPNAVDVTGKTPMFLAIEGGYLEVVKLLVHRKAKVNYRTEQGLTAITLAEQNNQTAIVEFLRRYGAGR